jgi:WD40 repeat protein
VETSNGRLLRSVELKNGPKDRCPIAWSADGNWLAQGDETGQITLWNLRSDKEAATFPAQLGPVKSLALSHDGRVLATLGEENKLHLWNLEGWQPKNRLAAKPKTKKPVPAD